MVTKPRQYDICANNGTGKAVVPYLLVLQHEVANVLDTRLAAPVIAKDSRQHLIKGLEPVISVRGVAHVAVISQMRALPLTDFGDAVGSAQDEHLPLVQAIDLLISGF